MLYHDSEQHCIFSDAKLEAMKEKTTKKREKKLKKEKKALKAARKEEEEADLQMDTSQMKYLKKACLPEFSCNSKADASKLQENLQKKQPLSYLSSLYTLL